MSNVTYISLEDLERSGRWGPPEEIEPSRTLPAFLASDLAGLPVPARKWHVENMVPANTVTLLYGDGATGKSLLSLQLGVATAIGQNWLGMATAAGPVLYLSAEDDRDELHRRLAEIVAALDQVELADLDRFKISPLAGEDAVLAAPTRKGGMIEPTPLWQAFEAEAIAWAPALIIADTLADVFGGEENVRVQARQFIGLMRGLAIRTGAAVVLLAHPSLTGLSSGSGTSGSTGWSNSVRSRLYFSRVKDEEGNEPDPDARVLEVKKANYARVGTELRLKWDRGVFVPLDAPAIANMDLMASQARAERIFLELLDTFTSQGRRVGPNRSANFAPSLFAKDPDAKGVTKTQFANAMSFLLRSKTIVVEETGPRSRRISQLVRAPIEAEE